jgi:ribonuclease HI
MEVSMSEVLHVVTDGSAIGNPGPGGWAAVLAQGKKRWEISGAKHWTTASEMELVAAVEALRGIPTGTRVELRSDCRYLIDGMRFHVLRWKRQEWRNRRGAKLQHQELWSELLHLNEQFHVRWKWIPGHNHHPRQTRADSLAYREARTLWYELKVAA